MEVNVALKLTQTVLDQEVELWSRLFSVRWEAMKDMIECLGPDQVCVLYFTTYSYVSISAGDLSGYSLTLIYKKKCRSYRYVYMQ